MIQVKTFEGESLLNDFVRQNSHSIEVVNITAQNIQRVVTGDYMNTRDDNGNAICLSKGDTYNNMLYILVYNEKK